MKYTSTLLLSFLISAFFVLFDAPFIYADDIRTPEKATDVAGGLEQKLLQRKFESVREDIRELKMYTENSAIPEEVKEHILDQIGLMERFLEERPSPTTTPTTFLLQGNEVYEAFAKLSSGSTMDTESEFARELTYLARKLKYEALRNDWDEIRRNTSDDLFVLISTIYRTSNKNAELWETLRPINTALEDGVRAQNSAVVYSAGEAYLEKIPYIESILATERERTVHASTNVSFWISVILFILLLLAYFAFFRKGSTETAH